MGGNVNKQYLCYALHKNPDPKLNEVKREWASVGIGLGPGCVSQGSCTQRLGREEAHSTHPVAVSRRVPFGDLHLDFSLKTP